MKKEKLLFILLLLLLTGCQTSPRRYPISNHYNGKVFYNQGICEKTKWEVFQELASRNFCADYCWFPAYHRPAVSDNLKTGQVKITFINHASVLIQSHSLNILTDPVWSYKISNFPFAPIRARNAGIRFNELPIIDVVLISHNHYDHLDLPTLTKLNKRFHPLFLVPLGDKKLLIKNGIDHVVELDWWQTYKVKNAIITFLPAQHWSSRWLYDIYQSLWGSYGITLEHKKIYFAGDTGYGPHFNCIAKKWGHPDFSLLPIGGYEPRTLTRYYHLSPAQAVMAHYQLHSKRSLAIHFGTFAMGSESLAQPVIDLQLACKCWHLSQKDFFILPNGYSNLI